MREIDHLPNVSAYFIVFTAIEIVFQDFMLCPDLKGIENIFLGREKLSFGFLRKDHMKKLLRRAREKVGFEVDVEKVTGELSGGQQQLIAIIRVFLFKPDILLLDEPTNHMDMESKFAIERAMNSYLGSIIVVSHDRRFLDNVVDRIFFMSNETIRIFKGNYSQFRVQLQSDIDLVSSEDFIYGSDGKLKKYIVIKPFTEWSSHKKYKIRWSINVRISLLFL